MHYSGYATDLIKWRGLHLSNYIWVSIYLRWGICFFHISNLMQETKTEAKVSILSSKLDRLYGADT